MNRLSFDNLTLRDIAGTDNQHALAAPGARQPGQ
jgi:hypothetical protein